MLRAADNTPEYCVEPLILRLSLKEWDLTVQDGRVCHNMASEGEMGTDFGELRAQADLPGVVNIFCALLVRLGDAHVEQEGILVRHKVDLRVDDILRPQDEVPREHNTYQ